MSEGETFRRAFLACEAKINDAGLEIDTMLGPWPWLNFMREQMQACMREGRTPPKISTAFDPTKATPIDTLNTVSLMCVADGVPKAAIVIRLYQERLRYLLDGKLWQPTGDLLRLGFEPVTLPAETPLDARVSQRGGMFIDHGYRGNKLGNVLADAALASAFRLWPDPDLHSHCVGLRMEGFDRNSTHIAYIGKAQISTDEPVDEWLAWDSRDSALDRFHQYRVDDGSNVTPFVGHRPQ